MGLDKAGVIAWEVGLEGGTGVGGGGGLGSRTGDALALLVGYGLDTVGLMPSHV